MKTKVKKPTTNALNPPDWEAVSKANFSELEARVAVIEGWVKGQQTRLEGARKVLDEAEHQKRAKEFLSPIFPGLQWVSGNVGVATLPKEIPAGYKLRTKKGAKHATPKV
jgi:hypothetical protein